MDCTKWTYVFWIKALRTGFNASPISQSILNKTNKSEHITDLDNGSDLSLFGRSEIIGFHEIRTTEMVFG